VLLFNFSSLDCTTPPLSTFSRLCLVSWARRGLRARLPLFVRTVLYFLTTFYFKVPTPTMEKADRNREALFGPTSSRPSTAADVHNNDNNNSSTFVGSDQAAPAPGQRGRDGGRTGWRGGRGFGEQPSEGDGGGGSWGIAPGSYAANWQQQPPQQQQQQQPLSWAQVRDNIDELERRRGVQSAYESVEIGRERSARVLRGMTFWGKIRNTFSDDPQVPEPTNGTRGGATGDDARAAGLAGYNNPRGISAAKTDNSNSTRTSTSTDCRDGTPMEGFICPDCRRQFLSADALVAHFESAHHPSSGGGDGRGGDDDDDDDDARGGARTGAGAGSAGRGEGNAGHSSLKDQLFGSRGENSQADFVGGAARGGGG
ncbi:unnamed protein product, partial [Pylaiella littoralis]